MASGGLWAIISLFFILFFPIPEKKTTKESFEENLDFPPSKNVQDK
jgi:hypothetical protein